MQANRSHTCLVGWRQPERFVRLSSGLKSRCQQEICSQGLDEALLAVDALTLSFEFGSVLHDAPSNLKKVTRARHRQNKGLDGC